MPWRIEKLADHGVIEVIYDGMVTPAELHAAFASALAEGTATSCMLFLANLTALQGGHSIVDLYELIGRMDSAGIDRRMKEAIVMPPVVPEGIDPSFFEDAARNRGFNVRIFRSREDALAWLTGPPAPPTGRA